MAVHLVAENRQGHPFIPEDHFNVRPHPFLYRTEGWCVSVPIKIATGSRGSNSETRPPRCLPFENRPRDRIMLPGNLQPP